MQVVALVSGKGGVGKTTLSANLAVALAQRGKRVLLVDLDPQNVQRLHLGMDPDEIAGLAREGVGPESVFDSPYGVQFIPFGRVAETELEQFEQALRADSGWLAAGLDRLYGGNYDFVLLDTPPGPSVFLRQAMQAAHRALVVVLADAASYATIPKMLALIEGYTEQRHDFQGAHLVLNQMPTQSVLGHQVRSTLQSNYAALLVPVSVHRDSAVAQALAFERPVLEFEPGCKASLDLQYLADWLLDSMNR